MDQKRRALAETILTTIVAILVLVLAWSLLADETTMLIPAVAAVGLTVIAFATVRSTISPDRVRAIQTNRTLKVASKTLQHLQGGMENGDTQAVCEVLLPETQAMAIAMTDKKKLVGYSGRFSDRFPMGSEITSDGVLQTLATGETVVVSSDEEMWSHVGRSWSRPPASIIVPLKIRDVSVGALKFFYEQPSLVDETQMAIANGLAELLSTQLLLSELDRQSELRARAELRALQTQIRPHFLFNTINTIAAYIRTDPTEARILLREFASFYRQTLENASDLIPLERELMQTRRYFGFELARFGQDRLKMIEEIEPGLEGVLVPAFVVQPIVENAVNHAMRATGQLTVRIRAYSQGDDVFITVSDDGVGMDEDKAVFLGEVRQRSEGTGIALKNVNGRLKGYFGEDSTLLVESTPDVGTTVTMTLSGAQRMEEDEDE